MWTSPWEFQYVSAISAPRTMPTGVFKTISESEIAKETLSTVRDANVIAIRAVKSR